jgi:hypothetical protein
VGAAPAGVDWCNAGLLRMEKAMTLARAKSVAGVRIPDTALCNAAVEPVGVLLTRISLLALSAHVHFRKPGRQGYRTFGGG